MLEGKKTYIIAVIIFALGGAKALGYIDQSIYDMLLGFLAPAGLVSLRMGMKK